MDLGRDAFQLIVNIKTYDWAKKFIRAVFTKFIIQFTTKLLTPTGFSENLQPNQVESKFCQSFISSHNEIVDFIFQVHSFYAYLKCYGPCKDPAHVMGMSKIKLLLSELAKCTGNKSEQAVIIANEAVKVVQGFKLCGNKEWNNEIKDLVK